MVSFTSCSSLAPLRSCHVPQLHSPLWWLVLSFCATIQGVLLSRVWIPRRGNPNDGGSLSAGARLQHRICAEAEVGILGAGHGEDETGAGRFPQVLQPLNTEPREAKVASHRSEARDRIRRCPRPHMLRGRLCRALHGDLSRPHPLHANKPGRQVMSSNVLMFKVVSKPNEECCTKFSLLSTLDSCQYKAAV